jgi:hypothetical protein
VAKGWTNKSVRPEGREVFAEAPNLVRHEAIPPGGYADGQTRDGTPAANVHSTYGDGKRAYADREKYRADRPQRRHLPRTNGRSRGPRHRSHGALEEHEALWA